jgi:hypothetical protein
LSQKTGVGFRFFLGQISKAGLSIGLNSKIKAVALKTRMFYIHLEIIACKGVQALLVLP